MSKVIQTCWILGLILLLGCQQETPSKLSSVPQKDFISHQVIEWRLATSWPKNLPGLGMAPERFAQLVEQMSNGRLVITVYGAGELMPALSVFDGVSNGTIEMAHSASYYWKGKAPAAQFFSSIPFGLNAQQMNAWLHYGGGMELWEEVYQPFGVLPLAGGNTGMQMGGWFNKIIASPEDFKGLKMRLPGLGGEVLKKLGGVPVDALAGRELYGALQTGAIDAAEWVGPYNDLSLGLHQVAKYYYYPGWHEPGSTMEFLINQQAFSTLPNDLKMIVKVAARAINQDMLDDYTQGHIVAMDVLLNEHNVQVKLFPNTVIRALKYARDDVLNSEAAKDPLFNKVLESYMANEKSVKRYFSYTEDALSRFELDDKNQP
ncbi:TRAP transporter substrate-binding protein [Shewanella frigidimarina]|uniref:ABC transporter substrate-binding protein n=1 Tax=Shewanella frigidimarina TaxID=56812 RepID=A0A106BYZ5_SHEFR|nr:TRAP transporter substrate-binding protein DctP [Shewanella frigidimarina]KVX01114.1 ABC transporter substrate-binding protein [Shewanella frigidimarina]